MQEEMDPQIKKYTWEKIVVLVSWPGHSDYKKNQKNYISGKKHEKKCIKKVGKEINRVACKLAPTPCCKKNRSPVFKTRNNLFKQ